MNQSLKSETFPEDLKAASDVQIYKSGKEFIPEKFWRWCTRAII